MEFFVHWIRCASIRATGAPRNTIGPTKSSSWQLTTRRRASIIVSFRWVHFPCPFNYCWTTIDHHKGFESDIWTNDRSPFTFAVFSPSFIRYSSIHFAVVFLRVLLPFPLLFSLFFPDLLHDDICLHRHPKNSAARLLLFAQWLLTSDGLRDVSPNSNAKI